MPSTIDDSAAGLRAAAGGAARACSATRRDVGRTGRAIPPSPTACHVFRCAQASLVLLQPDRGRAWRDRKSGYHDTELPAAPCLRRALCLAARTERIDALVHLGTHGTLEWLPGKALALSAECWPEAVLGPLPVIYPFIVNNPGEAVQAKRRLGAVTIGHLTPPLSAAGLHGPLAELEGIIEEYAAADGLDRRRLAFLEEEIVERAWSNGSRRRLRPGARASPTAQAIAKLDAQLCDIKELSDPRRPARLRPLAGPRRHDRARSSPSDGSGCSSAGGHDRRLRLAERARRPCSPRSTGAAWRRGPPARRPAAAPTCCRPAATSPRSIRAPSRLAPPLRSACARPTRSCAAICRITASIRARW